VNIFATQAYHSGKIRVTGGPQQRPNIHIADMCEVYLHLLRQPAERIDGKIWNAGDSNFPIAALAEMAKNVVGPHVAIETVPTNDPRSYRVSGRRIREEIGFELKHSIEGAVRDLVDAFKGGLLADPLNNPMYYNIKRMRELNLA
jgi:nucleoside-diphosphate-sugar epimerase